MEQNGVCCTQWWESCTFALSFQYLFGVEKKRIIMTGRKNPTRLPPKSEKMLDISEVKTY